MFKNFNSLIKKRLNKIIYLLFFIIIILSISTCNKPIPFSLNIYPIEKNMSYQRGVIKLINENIYVRYLITNYDENHNNSDNIILKFIIHKQSFNFD